MTAITSGEAGIGLLFAFVLSLVMSATIFGLAKTQVDPITTIILVSVIVISNFSMIFWVMGQIKK